ncbi:MAG TPA: hypothetical protein VHN98_02710 [Acidimicrobiales bacterium]|nr:hypothetical protein [Acidimicrobiales bacterium]
MGSFAGTGVLVRLALRRSRVLAGAWLGVFVLMAWGSAAATVGLYPTASSRLAAAEAVNGSQALVALYGRVYDPTSLGAIAMIKMGGIGAVFVAVVAIVLVVRHTRGDEESGRFELVGSGVMGRLAPLTAALLTATVVAATLAALTALVLAAAGLPADGSLAFGLAWGGVGLAFAAIAAVTAQLTASARTATSFAVAVLAVVYVLRGVGDAAGTAGLRWLTWMSPIGWSQQFRPYAGNRWWVLLITLVFTIATSATAYVLAAGRDMGTGLLPSRPGPPTAAPSLRSPLTLAWRLQRTSFLAWAIGFVALGALLGSMASGVGGFFESDNARELFTKLGGQKALADAFLAVELGAAGIVAAAFGIQSMMRARAEETSGLAEPVLAGAVSRTRFALAHVGVAAGGATALLALGGAAVGVARAVQLHDGAEIGRLLGGGLAHAPAAWVLIAVVAAAYGFVPRAIGVGWGLLAAFVLLAEIGPLLDLSHWVLDLSPFAHVPKVPGGAFTATPLVALTALATVIGGAGIAGFRRRDVG